MRIIAGKKRGCPIAAPDGLNTRPTLDRVREAIFGMLQPEIPGSTVLDLFAGSGAMGLEAVSRYAKRAVFCDKARESAACVRANIEKLGFSEQCTLYQCDYMVAIATARSEKLRFDIVFLDPPYEYGLAELAIKALLEADILAESGLIVWEHAAKPEPQLPEGIGVRLRSRKKYGIAGVSILEKDG